LTAILIVMAAGTAWGQLTDMAQQDPWESENQIPGQPGDLLSAWTQPQFVNPLPNPLDPSFIFQPMGACPSDFPADCEDCYQIGMYQIEQDLGLKDEEGGPMLTTVWGYGTGPGFPAATFPGRTFIAQGDGSGVDNRKVCVQWTNDLTDDAGEPLPHLLPIDRTLHWAFSLPGYTWEDYLEHGVPVVPHVHGGHTESDSDGLPEYWWTPGESAVGPRFVKSLYEYDNDQEAGTVWYHDHGLGITRLNVYAGLAGFFLIRDDVDTGLPDNPLGLPAFPYEVPIVIQDRLFTEGGELFYPTEPDELEPGFPPPPDPSALPEFFGDFILVNGQLWPYLDVEPRQYRLRLLNGSDSRFYTLWVNAGDADERAPDGNGPQIVVIGTDDALLYAPAPVSQLTFGPGERYDVIIDFSGWEGQTLIMRNRARSPFPKGDTPNPRTEGRIMAFNVGSTVSVPDNPLPETLRSAPIDPETDFGPSVRTRRLLLFEGVDQFGRLQPMLGAAEPTVDVQGNVVNGTLLWDEHVYPISVNPMLGDVDVWEVYNTAADAHPIHLHLVAFQMLGRQKFMGDIDEKEMESHDGSTSLGGVLTDIDLIGTAKPPAAHESGWKDTALMYPGEVTRIIAKFDRPGRYVWHCHIISHEDHEMMRPYCIGTYGVDCIDPMSPASGWASREGSVHRRFSWPFHSLEETTVPTRRRLDR
jgi:spore coat protein A